ncbi:hypothetical protein SAY87_003759 [Trapa incisa]|uniref:Uncharacterized protein n=1 Tax=Trapa incisa TaxID=236973 RepID=A0AAN7QJM7_9MYRT|nr:hypothetical protein SAY87_003759 [Trapa incisa]
MSRCFPFPPPRYARKAGVESSANVDLLKQHAHILFVPSIASNVVLSLLKTIAHDNHKEKKDKKEKNRKKREGKEREEKHRSDDKHRDKKEKKDKHRDRKDKNKGKEKDHTSSLSDKKLSFQAGGTNEETTPKVKGFLPSLLASGLSIDRSVQKEKERDKHRTIAPYGNKPAGQSAEKIPTCTNLSRDTCDNNKFVQELEERIKHDRISGTHLAERFIVAEKKKDDPLVQFLEKPNSNMRPEVEESNKERRDNESMVERVNGTCKVHDVVRIFHTRVKDEINLVEQNIQREIHWREKVKGMDGEDNWADEIKGKDDQRKDQGKVELDREDKERMGEKIEPSRHSEQEKLKISRKNDSLR